MGYFKTTVSGISWSAGQRWLIRCLTFVRLAILARLLVPAQFGVFGIATLTLGLLEVITETAINYFLVQEKGSIDSYIDTAWVISVFRGLIISLVLFILSPFISWFFHSPDALPILMLVSVVPLIRGFINPSVAKLQKDLLFKKEFKIKAVLFFADTIVTIGLALIFRNPYSLVFGMTISALLEVILSFYLFVPRPQFIFNRQKAKVVFLRGKWITAAGIFNYLFQNGDNMVVGRMLGTASLGYYDYAYKISGLPVSEISDVVARVSFPVYVQINHDKARLKTAFLRTTLVVCGISSILGLGLFLFAKPLILVVLGSQWLPAVPALRVLSLCGVAKSITGSAYPLFLATQKNDYITYITLVSVLGLGLSIYPLVLEYGIVGAGIAAIIGAFSSLPLSLYYVGKIINH